MGEDEPLTLSDVVPELGLQYVGFCADRPPFSNELVREAFCHAVDRELLVAQYPRSGLAQAASRGGAIPPAMPAHSHRVGLEYDLEKARALLDEAGYPGGKGLPELELRVPHWLQPVEPIAELWRPIGATVNPSRRRRTSTGTSSVTRTWVDGLDGRLPGSRTASSAASSRSAPWPFYRDDDILELLERGRSLRDQGERMRVYHEVDRLWVGEHAAILPIAYPRSTPPAPAVGRGPVGEPAVTGAPGHRRRRRAGGRARAGPGPSAVPVPDEA